MSVYTRDLQVEVARHDGNALDLAQWLVERGANGVSVGWSDGQVNLFLWGSQTIIGNWMYVGPGGVVAITQEPPALEGETDG